MDIRNSSGQAVNPAAIQDEDLKLYALQALSQQDPAQAVPLLERTIRGANSSPKLRERALFVLAQMSDPRARKLLADAAKDDAHPEVQSKAIQYLGRPRRQREPGAARGGLPEQHQRERQEARAAGVDGRRRARPRF